MPEIATEIIMAKTNPQGLLSMPLMRFMPNMEVTNVGIIMRIVVDDTLIGVHRRLKNVGVDAGGLTSLGHLNIYVLNEVGVEFVNLQLELQLRQQVLVTSDGGLEIGE